MIIPADKGIKAAEAGYFLTKVLSTRKINYNCLFIKSKMPDETLWFVFEFYISQMFY